MRWPFQKSPKILFLGGLSGAGKSTFARDCLEAKHRWLWIEIDLPMLDGVPRNGIDVSGLRNAWNAFLGEDEARPYPRPRPLHKELSRRAGNFDHVILSFSSRLIFKEDHLKAGRNYFHFAYMGGEWERCRDEFVERERREWRVSKTDAEAESYWIYNNAGLLGALKEPNRLAPLIQAFNPDGTRRDPEEIYREVLDLIDEPENNGGQLQS